MQLAFLVAKSYLVREEGGLKRVYSQITAMEKMKQNAVENDDADEAKKEVGLQLLPAMEKGKLEVQN